MANSTSQQRLLWSPPCKKHGDLLDAYAALDAWFAHFGYRIGPGSGAANCRPITGGTGYSLHSYAWGVLFHWWSGMAFVMGLAVDINPAQNPYGPRLVTNMPRPMVNGITGLRTKNGKQVWVWGGYFTPNHDAMHFQIGCSPADLATGIDPATLPSGPAPEPIPQEDPPMLLIQVTDGPDKDDVYLIVGNVRREQTQASAQHLIHGGVRYQMMNGEAWAQVKITTEASITDL